MNKVQLGFAAMKTLLERLMGAAGTVAHGLTADVAFLDTPGRPPQWPVSDAIKVRLFNTEAGFVEPFFNHLAGDTRSRKPV